MFYIFRSSDGKELFGPYIPCVIYSRLGTRYSTFWAVFKSCWILYYNAFDFRVSMFVLLETTDWHFSTYESIFIWNHRRRSLGCCYINLFCYQSYYTRTELVIWYAVAGFLYHVADVELRDESTLSVHVIRNIYN